MNFRLRLNEECLYDVNGTTDLSSGIMRVVPIEKIDADRYKVVPLDGKGMPFECDRSLLTPFKKHPEANVVVRSMFGVSIMDKEDVLTLKLIEEMIKQYDTNLTQMYDIYDKRAKSEYVANCKNNLDMIIRRIGILRDKIETHIIQDGIQIGLMYTDEDFKRKMLNAVSNMKSELGDALDEAAKELSEEKNTEKPRRATRPGEVTKVMKQVYENVDAILELAPHIIKKTLAKHKVSLDNMEAIGPAVEDSAKIISEGLVAAYREARLVFSDRVMTDDNFMSIINKLLDSILDAYSDDPSALVFTTGAMRNSNGKFIACVTSLKAIQDDKESFCKKLSNIYSHRYVLGVDAVSVSEVIDEFLDPDNENNFDVTKEYDGNRADWSGIDEFRDESIDEEEDDEYEDD